MPRGPRLDAPGILHHVMARGIEKSIVFRTDDDREDFIRRIAEQAESTGLEVLAWAVLPNHLHLLVRTGQRPLGSVMRRLLTGYAGTFNRRHKRHGHLFQNRYKSIVVEEEPYLMELVRYIHLNPIRAGLVDDLKALDRYPWCGHSAVMGRIPRPWQAVNVVLGQFARTLREARRRYRNFVAEGARQGRRPDLQGGGLRRSTGGGWEALADLRRGRESWAFDERVLGGGEFVERILQELASRARSPKGRMQSIPNLAESLASAFGLHPTEILTGSRRRTAAHARAALSTVAVRYLGLPASRVAGVLGVTGMAVTRGADRGERYLRERKLDPEWLARMARK